MGVGVREAIPSLVAFRPLDLELLVVHVTTRRRGIFIKGVLLLNFVDAVIGVETPDLCVRNPPGSQRLVNE